MMNGRKIIADDFGLGRHHDAVILELLGMGGIDGTSVFAKAPMDDSHIEQLLELRQTRGIEIGVHLNLTDVIGQGDTRRSIVKLWLSSMISGGARRMAFAEFTQQIEMFQGKFGISPDYIDGHQHCHAIPAFWEALQPVSAGISWVRSPCPNSLRGAISQIQNGGAKSILVMFWGWRLRRRLRKSGVQTNADFNGLIAYHAPKRFRQAFSAMIVKTNSLTMVHPGAATDPHQIDGHENQFRATEAALLQVKTDRNE